jgi:hypothetical protein
MVAPYPNLDNTVRKWSAVYNALLKGGRITRRGASVVMSKNAPAYTAMYNNYNQAHAGLNNGNLNNQTARNYFKNHPHLRKHITDAYKKLPNANKQLNSVARKVMAARKIQEAARKLLKERNKKEKNNKMRNATRAMARLPATAHLPHKARQEILEKIKFNVHTRNRRFGPFRPRMAKYPTY